MPTRWLVLTLMLLSLAAPLNGLAAKHPPGASAQCRDGTYSYSHHRRGTCSYHHGVLRWLRQLPP